MQMKNRAFAILIALAPALASCASNSYHAYEGGAGYSEEQVDAQTWRVNFVGSTVESQAAVEQQLLRRSAELTVQSGYDWFTPNAQETQQQEDIVVTGERPRAETGSNAEAVWHPRWRRRNASRWTDWDPQGAVAPEAELAPVEPSARAVTELRYSATAQITMGRAPAPAGAFDARAILAQSP